jgi:hypothetical protein
MLLLHLRNVCDPFGSQFIICSCNSKVVGRFAVFLPPRCARGGSRKDAKEGKDAKLFVGNWGLRETRE